MQPQTHKLISWLFLISIIIIVIIISPIVWYMALGISVGNWITNKAAKDNNPSLCTWVPSTYDGNTSSYRCYYKVAVENSDPTICKNLLDAKYCNQDVGVNLEKKALSQKDINFCKQIVDDGQRESCYMHYSLSTGEESGCNLQPTEANKNYCLARTTKSISYCLKIGDTERLNPYNTWNASSVVGGAYFTKAKNVCFFDVGIIQGNESFCNQISEQYNNQELISECVWYGKRDADGYCKTAMSHFGSERECKNYAHTIINGLQSLNY